MAPHPFCLANHPPPFCLVNHVSSLSFGESNPPLPPSPPFAWQIQATFQLLFSPGFHDFTMKNLASLALINSSNVLMRACTPIDVRTFVLHTVRMHNVVESLIRYTKGLRILRSPPSNETQLLQSCSGNAAFWSQMPDGSRDKTAGLVGEFWDALKSQKRAQDWHHDAIIWQFLFCSVYRN